MPRYQIKTDGGTYVITTKGKKKPESRSIPNEIPRSNLLTDPVETLKRSGGEFASGIADAVLHPIQTAKGIGNLALGLAQKVIPGEQSKEVFADALGQMIVDRYGSLDRAKKTALEDPVGFASDVSIFLTGGGSAITKIGKVSKSTKLTGAGNKISSLGSSVDPVTSTARATGKGLNLVTRGKKVVPFGSSRDLEVVQAAKELGVDLPASAISKNRAVPLAEALTVKGPFGRKLGSKVDNAKLKMVEIGDKLISKTGKSDDLTQVGEAISSGMDRFRDNFFKIKDALYDNAGFNVKGKKISISPDNAKQTLLVVDEILSQKQGASKIIGSSKSNSLFKKIKSALQGEKLTRTVDKITDSQGRPITINEGTKFVDATDIKSALDELNEALFTSTDPVITGNKAKLKKLAATLSKDLDNAVLKSNPKLARELELANRFFKLSIREVNSHFGKQIQRFKDQPDKILPAILKPSISSSDVKRIYRLIGRDNVSQVQAAFLREFLEGAKNATKDSFTPTGLSRQLSKFGRDKLSKILTEDQLKTIDNLSKTTKGLGRFEKIAEGSATAFSARIALELAPLLNMDVLKTLLLIGGDKLLSSVISSKSGQKLLAGNIGFDIAAPFTRSAKKAGDTTRKIRIADLLSGNQDSD